MSARMPILVAVLLGGLCHSVNASEPDVDAILARWAEASHQGPRLSAAILKTRYGAVHSAHELDAASDLLGPVDVEKLRQRFNWSGEVSSQGTVTLVAQPRDTVEQLFYDHLKITIDAATALPASIRFVAADGTPRPVAIQQRRPNRDSMVLQVAAGEMGGGPIVHTAAFTPSLVDVNGIAAAELDVEQVLRAWERHRRSGGVRALMFTTSQGTASGKGAAAGKWAARAEVAAVLPAGAEQRDASRTPAAVSWMFESSAEELLAGYDWTVLAADGTAVVLEAKPRRKSAGGHLYRFQLIIDPETGTWLSGDGEGMLDPDVPSLLAPAIPATAVGPVDGTAR